MPRGRMQRLVAFTIAVEIGAALAALAAPAQLVQLLLGAPADAATRAVTRCFGIALLALAAAWWPDRYASECAQWPFRGRLLYNGLIALFLAYLASGQHMSGPLLWPAILLHAAVSALLIVAWRARRI